MYYFTNGRIASYNFLTTILPILLFAAIGVLLIVSLYRRLVEDEKVKAVGLAFILTALGFLLYGCTNAIAYFD